MLVPLQFVLTEYKAFMHSYGSCVTSNAGPHGAA